MTRRKRETRRKEQLNGEDIYQYNLYEIDSKIKKLECLTDLKDLTVPVLDVTCMHTME